MTQDRHQDPARGQKNQAIKSWLIWYFRQPFVMIVWFMETFAKNRDRVKATLARQDKSLWWGLDEQSDCEPQPWQQPAPSSGGAK